MTWDDLVEAAIKRGVDPDAPVIVVVPHVGETAVSGISVQSDAILIHLDVTDES